MMHFSGDCMVHHQLSKYKAQFLPINNPVDFLQLNGQRRDSNIP
jgi:hypothetical protein